MLLNLQKNIPLNQYSTMRLGGEARYLLDIKNQRQIPKAIQWAEKKSLPVIMIGGGSNIIFTDEGFNGLVLVNKIEGFKLEENDSGAVLVAGAGENWDSVVARTIEHGLSGIEQLSLIPGSTGATPIQNVGAYGREIAEVLISVEAYDTKKQEMVEVASEDCRFSYRNSRFKSEDKGRFFITSVKLSLSNDPPLPPFYASLQAYLDEHGIRDYTSENIRGAVIAVRQSKLPDPAKVANCGSFFKNPVISLKQLDKLRDRYPGVKYWETGENSYKISAAWLLDQLGLKGYHDSATGMATWPRQPLVFVNEHAKDTDDLLEFSSTVAAKVKDKFTIVLEQEPELI
jgi:UDP-N-acetylmuramate dehydrogenase